MVIPIMMMDAVDLKVMMCDGEDGEVDDEGDEGPGTPVAEGGASCHR